MRILQCVVIAVTDGCIGYADLCLVPEVGSVFGKQRTGCAVGPADGGEVAHRDAARTTLPGAKCRRASKSAENCSAALTKKVVPTRQSDVGRWLTRARSGAPISGAITNMMLLMELRA